MGNERFRGVTGDREERKRTSPKKMRRGLRLEKRGDSGESTSRVLGDADGGKGGDSSLFWL